MVNAWRLHTAIIVQAATAEFVRLRSMKSKENG